MQELKAFEFIGTGREESMPWMRTDFPCISSRACLDFYPCGTVPWHWHNTFELFYIESGTLRYRTPSAITELYAGCGGLANVGVLHTTTYTHAGEANVQLVHQFLPEFISGGVDNRIQRKYIDPIIMTDGFEFLSIQPDTQEDCTLLHALRDSFSLDSNEMGYEIRLRERISMIWLELLPRIGSNPVESIRTDRSARVKRMMAFICENLGRELTVGDIAAAGTCSERECYRAFAQSLHMTPGEYLQNMRLQAACRMLSNGRCSITEVALNCGFGSSSYFTKVFRRVYGCTPSAYRTRTTIVER